MKQLRPVFLIRHPKPDIAPGFCYGSSDVPATRAALEAAFVWLDRVLPSDTQIISSPLARCAVIAAQLGSRAQRGYKFDARLAERSCGVWELQAWDQLPRAELDAWAADFMDYCAPGAESVRQMQTRVLSAWHEQIGQLDQQQPFALTTHAGPIQVLLAHLTGAVLSPEPVVEIACGAAVWLTPSHDDAGFWSFQIIPPASAI